GTSSPHDTIPKPPAAWTAAASGVPPTPPPMPASCTGHRQPTSSVNFVCIADILPRDGVYGTRSARQTLSRPGLTGAIEGADDFRKHCFGPGMCDLAGTGGWVAAAAVAKHKFANVGGRAA